MTIQATYVDRGIEISVNDFTFLIPNGVESFEVEFKTSDGTPIAPDPSPSTSLAQQALSPKRGRTNGKKAKWVKVKSKAGKMYYRAAKK